MKYLKGFNWYLLLAMLVITAIIQFAFPVFGIVWTATITVPNPGSAYSYPQIQVNTNNTQLIAGGYADSNMLDVLIKTANGTSMPMLPTEDVTWFTTPSVAGNSYTTFTWSSDNALKSQHQIVVGNGGYVTTADVPALEPGRSFNITVSGYFAQVGSGDIFRKQDAIRLSYNTTGITLTAGNESAPDLTLTALMTANSHVIRAGTVNGESLSSLGVLSDALVDTDAGAGEAWAGVLYELDAGLWALTHSASNDEIITTYTVSPTTGVITAVDSETIASGFASGKVSRLVHIFGDVYAFVWAYNDGGGTQSVKIRTYDIDSAGTITTGGIATYTNGTDYNSAGFVDEPLVVGDTGSAKIIAFSENGAIWTFSIAYNGASITLVEREVVAAAASGWGKMTQVSGTTYALTQVLDGTTPDLYTYEITAAGNATLIDSQELDLDNSAATTIGRVANIANLGTGNFLIYFYDNGAGAGTLVTYPIANDGTIGALIDTDTTYTLMHASEIIWMGDYVFMLPTDPVTTLTVNADGTFGAAIDTLDIGGANYESLGMVSTPSTGTVFVGFGQTAFNNWQIVSFTGGAMNGFVQLALYVDDMGTAEDAENMPDSIPDNANNWVWYPQPYWTYVLTNQIQYQPNDIIYNDNLPDLDTGDGAHNGTITWGTADLSGNMSSFTPPTTPTPPTTSSWNITTPTPTGFLPTPTPTSDFRITPTPRDFPGRDIIDDIADAGSTPRQVPWMLITGFIILVASLTTSWAMRRFGSGNLWGKLGVIIGLMGVFVGLGVYDFWMILIFALIAVAIAMGSRQPTWN